MDTLSERLKTLRNEFKYTQSEIAQKVGTTKQTISNWENGSKVPGRDKLKSLAEEYGVTVDFLLNGIKYDNKSEVAADKEVEELSEKLATALKENKLEYLLENKEGCEKVIAKVVKILKIMEE